MPKALRWLGVGWGKYDVVHMSPGAPQSGWVLVSEPMMPCTWVMSRTPQLDEAQWAAAGLHRVGLDLQRPERAPAASVPLRA